MTRPIEEFEHAGSRSNDLESAVGSPYGERALRDAASDFEGRWDDRQYHRGREIYDKTLGIIGPGRIGSELIRLVRPSPVAVPSPSVPWAGSAASWSARPRP